jgi:hypothetical protein
MASYAHTFTSGDTLTPTKLNNARTVSNIVNADIDSAAAIVGTKVAPAFGAQDITVSGGNRSITNTTNHALSFGTNNATRVTIPAAGGMNVSGSVSAATEAFGGFTMTSNATTGNAEFLSNRSRGTSASPTIVQNNDLLMLIAARGYDGSAYTNAAFISAFVNGTPSAGDMPGMLTFSTTPDGSNTPSERMRIDAIGNVGIGTAIPTFRLVAAGGAQDGVWLGASSTVSQVGLGDYSSGSTASFQIRYDRSSGITTISNGNRDAPTERMRFAANGNIGIAAASPSHLLDVAGDINTSEQYLVDGTQVVSNRGTGWEAATGTATRTTFATSTVNTAQLAQRVKALIDDLTTHGLIGA